MVKQEKKIHEKTANTGHASNNLGAWIIGLLIINIVLTIGLIVSPVNTPSTGEKQINSINEKVSAIDNFFAENVEGYSSDSKKNAEKNPSESDYLKADITADDDPYLGNTDAKVEVIEFSDYQCPFCRKYWTETYPQLKEEYIDTGKIKYVFRDFPLNFHQGAIPAAIAGNCIREQLGNEAYFEYHDIAFGEQNKEGSGTIQFGEEEVMSWVSQIDGLDMNAFNTCYNDPAQKAEVDADFEAGAAAGVSGTPSFFINGKLIVGAQPYSVLKAEIDNALNS